MTPFPQLSLFFASALPIFHFPSVDAAKTFTFEPFPATDVLPPRRNDHESCRRRTSHSNSFFNSLRHSPPTEREIFHSVLIQLRLWTTHVCKFNYYSQSWVSALINKQLPAATVIFIQLEAQHSAERDLLTFVLLHRIEFGSWHFCQLFNYTYLHRTRLVN